MGFVIDCKLRDNKRKIFSPPLKFLFRDEMVKEDKTKLVNKQKAIRFFLLHIL